MTCKIEIKRDFYENQIDELTDYTTDPLVLINENILTVSKVVPFTPTPPPPAPTPEDWYPHVNSYYPYGEYVDPCERVAHLVASKPSNLSLNENKNNVASVPYSEQDAQQLYLRTKPLSFVVLSKPDVGETSLGCQLAEYWQCVYIEPHTILTQEIESGSRAGQCIEFNLRCGRTIGIDVILRLVAKRANSETAKHRGVLICGLPLIPNRLYKEEPLSSESAVFTAKQIFEELIDTTLDNAKEPLKDISQPNMVFKGEGADEDELEVPGEGVEEGEGASESPQTPLYTPVNPPPVDLGSDFDVCLPPEISLDYEGQLNFLFDLLNPPLFIVYIMCTPRDVILRRKNTKFNIYTNSVVDRTSININKQLYKYFTEKKHVYNQVPNDNFETYFYNNELEEYKKHNVLEPKNFPANIESQLDAFAYTGMNFIERKILTHDPQYFVKVDSRTSIGRMLDVVKAKLNCLPLQRVVIPERLSLDQVGTEAQLGAEDQQENPQIDTSDLSLEQCFQLLRKVGVPNDIFKWGMSDWQTLCPVALKHGIVKDGDAKFPVQFLNKIFFLSDEESYFKFYRNPRPYLLSPYPRPACKLFIFGPASSGKTSLAQCLSFLFDGVVVSTGIISNDFIDIKEAEFREKIRQEATLEAISILNEMRQKEVEELEAKRVEDIKTWAKDIIHNIERMEVLYQERLIELEGETKFELSSFPMALAVVEVTDIETEVAIALKEVKEELIAQNLPTLEYTEYINFLKEKQKLFNYLPHPLKKKNKSKPATPHDDFVIDYANRAAAAAIFEGDALIKQNLIERLIADIKEIEENALQQENKIGGWIVDGMYVDLNMVEKVCEVYLPDEIIVLKDTDDFEFLRERYKIRGANRLRNFRDLFVDLGKTEAAWKSPSRESGLSYKTEMAQQIISEIFDNPLLDGIVEEIPKNTENPDELENLTGDGDTSEKPKEKSEPPPDKSASLHSVNSQSPQRLVRDEDYYEECLKYNLKWLDLEPHLQSLGKDILEFQISDRSLPDLFKEIIRVLEDRYRLPASPFTEEDRAEEISAFHEDTIPEEAEGEGTVTIQVSGDEAMNNVRRYGDTYHYCPVTFHEHWVLWKGKETFAVKFQERVYLLSTLEDFKKFLLTPRVYLLNRPPKEMPPPRICIIGAPGCGKTDFAKALANNYGITYVSYEACVQNEFRLTEDITFEEMKYNREMPEDITKYLTENVPLPDDFYLTAIGSLWFKSPIKNFGFVLDDFPKRACDIDIMVKYKLIPDIVIELTNDIQYLKTTLVENRLFNWEKNIRSYRLQKEKEFEELLGQWEDNRFKKFVSLLEEKREVRYAAKMKEKETTDPQNPTEQSAKDELDTSQVSFDSIAEQQDIDEINRLLDTEMPMIIPQPQETVDDMRIKFDTRINEHIYTELDNLTQIRQVSLHEGLPYEQLPLDVEDYDKNIRYLYVLTESFKYRNISNFERCYEVSLDHAERLLSCGYFFLSKFGKLCPVEYKKNKNPFYPRLDQPYNLLPIIHRSFIYYIFGSDNLKAFKEHPLLYTNVNNIELPLVPIKVGVTGPPKCGKTTLANRIADEYGMKVISRGQAIRYVLYFLPYSSLAKNMQAVLRKGWELTEEMVAKCVEAASIDARAVTQGIVYDGFPNTITETNHLSYYGLVPCVVFDLKASQEDILECYENYIETPRGFFKYSSDLICHFFNQWKEESKIFQPWFDEEYQVTYNIPINPSLWTIWYRARKVIVAALFEVKHYYSKSKVDWPLRLSYMTVNPLEFLERKSIYDTFCPCCIKIYDILTTGGFPPDRTGLVQWRKHFYWICNEHIELFLRTPDFYLAPYTKPPPQHLPRIVKLTSIPNSVFENGVCVVCYRSKTHFVDGSLAYAIKYIDKVYLFDTIECFQTFLKRPHLYCFNIDFKPPHKYPGLDYKELPILGMLEQYVAQDVIKAVKYVSRRRPVIPGLSISVSGAIGVALHLKLNNQSIPLEYRQRYMEGDILYYSRRDKLLTFLDSMKNLLNPYLQYDEPIPKVYHSYGSSKSSEASSVRTHISHVIEEIIGRVVGRK